MCKVYLLMAIQACYLGELGYYNVDNQSKPILSRAKVKGTQYLTINESLTEKITSLYPNLSIIERFGYKLGTKSNFDFVQYFCLCKTHARAIFSFQKPKWSQKTYQIYQQLLKRSSKPHVFTLNQPWPTNPQIPSNLHLIQN